METLFKKIRGYKKFSDEFIKFVSGTVNDVNAFVRLDGRLQFGLLTDFLYDRHIYISITMRLVIVCIVPDITKDKPKPSYYGEIPCNYDPIHILTTDAINDFYSAINDYLETYKTNEEDVPF